MVKGKYMRYIDRIFGSILYDICSLKSKVCKNTKNRNKKILAIKLWALGETVLITPGLNELKNRGYKISILTSKYNGELAKLYDIFDEVIEIKGIFKTIKKLKKEKFGIVLDFEPFTKFSAVLAYLSGASKRIGFENRKNLYTTWVKPNEEEHAVKNFCRLCFQVEKFKIPEDLPHPNIKHIKKQNAISFHPGSAGSSISRRWPKEQWIELGKQITNKWPKMKIYITGSKDEYELCKNIAKHIGSNAIAKTLPLREFLELCTGLKAFIANDSGPMHMAAAVGCPTIGLFGPNAPERYGPYGKKNIGIRKEKSPPIVLPFAGKFPEDGGKSINKISVDDVFKKLVKII